MAISVVGGKIQLETEIGLPDGSKLAARAIAYDHETGFGLIRATRPLGIRPMELGNSGPVKTRDRVLVASFGGKQAAIGADVVSRRPFAGWWEYLIEDAIFISPPPSGVRRGGADRG